MRFEILKMHVIYEIYENFKVQNVIVHLYFLSGFAATNGTECA